MRGRVMPSNDTKERDQVSEEKLQSRPMSPRPATVTVRFDQQQRKLLDFLRAEGTFGTQDGEIIRNVVLDYLAQQKQQPARKAQSKRRSQPKPLSSTTRGAVGKGRSKR
jgi:hypothetical protein